MKLHNNVQRDLVIVLDEFEMMPAFHSATKECVTYEMTRTLVRRIYNTGLDVEDYIETVIHLDNRYQLIMQPAPGLHDDERANSVPRCDDHQPGAAQGHGRGHGPEKHVLQTHLHVPDPDDDTSEIYQQSNKCAGHPR
jgi:hypothetical protein